MITLTVILVFACLSAYQGLRALALGRQNDALEARNKQLSEQIHDLRTIVSHIDTPPLKELGVILHARAVNAGFWPRPEEPPSTDWVGCQIALIHSELSEALEALRDGKMRLYFREDALDSLHTKPEGAETELADALIRILDLGEGLGLDLDKAVQKKHEYNLTRPYRHGRQF